MKQRDDSVYLRHILDAIGLVSTYLKKVKKQTFLETNLLQDGAIRQIQIIGEATKLLSDDFKTAHPDVPWRDIAGMRDKLVHDYLGVDIEAVWETAQEDLPVLEKQVRALLKDLD